MDDPVYRALFFAQLGILVAGLAGFALRNQLLSKPYYFLLTNVAAFVATFRYLMGERMITWQPIR
jgi:hypothetical protein